MARGIDATTATAVGETTTEPYYLIEIGFPTPSRISSAQTISWDSKTWIAASARVRISGDPTIELFNEATAIGQIILNNGSVGIGIDIFIGYQNDSAHPNPVHVFSGEMGQVSIGEEIKINCRRYAPVKTPRHYAMPPHCNHLPRPGTQINTKTGRIILERP